MNATPFWLFFDKNFAFSLVFYEKMIMQNYLNSLTHITPYKLFIRLFFVEKQKLVVHPHKNLQRVFSYLYWEF